MITIWEKLIALAVVVVIYMVEIVVIVMCVVAGIALGCSLFGFDVFGFLSSLI